MVKNKAKTIFTEIRRIILHLVEIGLASDQNAPILRKHKNRITEVTFPNSENLSYLLKNNNYENKYQHLKSERAYNIMLPDGALILMRYRYIKNTLERHILGFYPSPNLDKFQDDPDIYIEDHIYADMIGRNIVPFPIRFDFDCRPEIFIPVKHPKSHLTLGEYKNCRIPLTSPLSPYWFISFLIKNFYDNKSNIFTDKIPNNYSGFNKSIDTMEEQFVHIKIPE